MKAAWIFSLGLMMSSVTGAAEPPSRTTRATPLQQTLPAKVSVFYPTRGQDQFGDCWIGLISDSEDNLYPLGRQGVSKILPDGTLVRGVNDRDFFVTLRSNRWAELDRASGKIYEAFFRWVYVAPFVDGAFYTELLSGLEDGTDVAIGKGPLAGSLLVTEPGAHRVTRIDLETLEMETLVTEDSFQPEVIESAPDGTLYTVDHGTVPPRLVRITPAGVLETIAVGTATKVNRAIAVDAAGNVYWSHARGLDKYDASGNFLGSLPGPPDQPEFGGLAGTAFDSEGNLYVVENFACKKIYKYTLSDLEIDVEVDIRSTINPKSKGVIAVVILTTDAFDATTIEPLSVRFGPRGATEAHGRGHIEDADGDGDLDLLLHFRTQDAGSPCGSISASLTGQTFDGQSIEGTDSIRMTGCK